MYIKIKISESELRQANLDPEELEDLVWEELVSRSDPYELLNVNLDIEVVK